MSYHVRLIGPAKDLNQCKTGRDAMIRPFETQAKAVRLAIEKDAEYLMIAFDSPAALQEWTLRSTLQAWANRVPELRRAVENEFGPVREHGLREKDRIDLALAYKRIEGLKIEVSETYKALQDVHFLLDGQEWTPETCDHIARILRGQQMIVRDVP